MAENHHAARFRPMGRVLVGPLLLALIVFGTFWKITLSHRQYTWLESPDLSNQVLPWLQFGAGEFHRGHFPLWDPYEWGGQSLIGQAQPAIAYPLNWILFSLPLQHGWIQQVFVDGYFVVIHLMAGLFCYWLCRDLRCSVPASVLSGSSFALSGWMGYTDWPQMVNGGVWAPLIFLFFFRMMGSEHKGFKPVKNAGLSGAMMGIAFLSGHHQIPIFIGLAIGGAWIYWLSTRVHGKLEVRNAACCLAAFALLFGLLGALQILPASDYGKQAVRWVGANNVAGWKDIVPYRVHSELSMPPVNILGLLVMPFSDHTSTYAGFTVLLMAVSGVVAGWSNVFVRIMAAVTLGGFLLALGQWNIFHGLIYAVLPQVDKARNIAFAAFLFGFGLSVLAAFGVDLFGKNSIRWKRALALVAAAGGVVLLTAAFLISQSSLPKTGDYNLVAMCGFVAILLSGILLCWQKGMLMHGRSAMVIVAVAEFGTSLGWGYRRADAPDYLLKKMSMHSEIAEWLRSRPGPVRIELDDQEITYNFGDWYGIEVYGGYLASLSTNVQNTAGAYPARALMGIRYNVARKALHPNQEVEVFHDRSGLKIWEHADAFPRVWSVHATRSITRPQMDAAFNAGLAKLREEAFFMNQPAPPVEKCSGDSVNLVRREANLVEIDASMQCKGMVIAGETYDKGWRATVDGISTPVLEAYATARAVQVAKGHHRIVMTFYSPAILIGGVMTGVGFLMLIALAFL